MSRLIDELNRISRNASQPIGFRTARKESSEPRITLIASISPKGTATLADCVDGADAALLHLTKSLLTAIAIPKIADALRDIPWGVYLDDIDDKKAAALVKAGCDFVVFTAGSAVTTTPQQGEVGKIIQVESSLDDGILRAVNTLPVDAALVTDVFEGEGSLLWHQLMIFRHLTSILDKPIIVPASLKAAESELKALWEAGVDGVVVEADTGKPGALKELREVINKLPPRTTLRKFKAGALLPRTGGESGTAAPDEEEEEEEYE
jgi:hypothetical protein